MIADRVYGALLLLFPRQFRARCAGPMRRIFRERYAAAAAAGRWPLAAFLARSVVDVALNAALERASAARQWVLFPNDVGAGSPGLSGVEGRSMLWQAMLMDLRYALRMFVRTPVFSGLTVMALALGIGANSAIFGVANGVLLKPLPYANPDRLVMVWSNNTNESQEQNAISPANYVDFKAGSKTLERVEAMRAVIFPNSLVTQQGPTDVTELSLTPGMFTLLGREAIIGRTLREDELRGAIVLSYGFWQRQFGGDPSIVGRHVTTGPNPVTVAGVMPPDFVFPYPAMLGPAGVTGAADVDVWSPSPFEGKFFEDDQGRLNRDVHFLAMLGRMRDGVDVEQVRAEMTTIARQLEQSYPETNTGWGATVVPMHEQAVGNVRPALMLLVASVGFVLLIACVNVANLLLARGVARRREMAVRAALGAGRTRLVRQMLTESLALSFVGAAIGLLSVAWTTRVLVALAPSDIPRLHEVAADCRVVAFTVLIAIATGISIGLVPALAVSRSDVRRMLTDVRGITGSAAGRRMRMALATTEIVLAVMLTVGAGLLARSFVRVLHVNSGFVAENLLTMRMGVPGRYENRLQERSEFLRQFFETIESIPGVVSAGGTTELPLGSASNATSLTIEGRDGADQPPKVEMRRSLGDYFRTMGIPIVAGRGFHDRDTARAPGVAVVNQTLARRFFPGQDPIGRRVRFGPNPAAPWWTIVGVAGDIRHQALEVEPAPEVYIHYLQAPPVAPFIVIRTAGDPAAMVNDVRAAVRAFDRGLTPFAVRTMAEIRSDSVARRRFVMSLAAAFGVLALALAGIGVYGVMALVVTERTQEMGIRLALGAAPVQVLALVVGQGLMLAGIGVAIGVAASLALTPMMASQLYGVGMADPVTLGGVPALLLVVAFIACVVPARRAMRVDPVTALRCE